MRRLSLNDPRIRPAALAYIRAYCAARRAGCTPDAATRRAVVAWNQAAVPLWRLQHAA